jgi:translocation and assembly module TamA
MLRTRLPAARLALIGPFAIAGLFAIGAAGEALADTPYEVTIRPTGDDALDSALGDASQLATLEDKPPDSEAALRNRAANDRDRLNAVARAYGYYDDAVDIALDMKARPVKVTIAVIPGPRYVLASVAIVDARGAGFPAGAPIVTAADAGLQIGAPATSAPVAGANGRIEHIFRSKGFPFARIADRKAIVNHDTKEMEVTYSVDPGPSALFGPTAIDGLSWVRQAYVVRRLRWTDGAPYDVSLIDKTKDALVASNLFSTVDIKTEPPQPPAATPPATTQAVVTPIAIDVTERSFHSVSAGASYASTEGVSINASWEDRNVFGEAEDLRFAAQVGQEQKAITADFRKPDYWGLNWDLVTKAAVLKDNTEAYVSDGERLFGGVEYKGLQAIALGGGIALEHATVSDYDLRQRYTLAGFPLYAKRDASNDLLNPTTGDREGMTLTPYVDPTRPALHFLTGRVTGSYYLPLGDGDRYVLAAFGAIGATVGISLDDLPKDKRFYAGGGGSIRGYAFQRAGPLGVHDEPVGGLSSLETSLELRYKLTETIGIVPFVDAGNVYSSDFPDFGRRLLIGAGIGVRYYTGLGPLRLDLATPLHQREGDRPLQLYVSLGQAF